MEHTAPRAGGCDSCYEEAHNLVYDGLRELLEVYGTEMYVSGRDNLAEPEGARRALEALVARARVI